MLEKGFLQVVISTTSTMQVFMLLFFLGMHETLPREVAGKSKVHRAKEPKIARRPNMPGSRKSQGNLLMLQRDDLPSFLSLLEVISVMSMTPNLRIRVGPGFFFFFFSTFDYLFFFSLFFVRHMDP